MMNHSVKSTMLMGTFLFGLIICLTSCEDILGTWDKPTPAVVTPSEPETPSKVPTTTGHALSESVVGEVVGTNGLAYDVAYKDDLPTGVSAAGMVAYKSGSIGLVIALYDTGELDWSTANGANGAAAHSPAVTGQTWKVPSQDEWKLMFSANGGNEASYTGLNMAITNAGGTALQGDNYYWSSTEHTPGNAAYLVELFSGGSTNWPNSNESSVCRVRACLAF